MSSESASYVPPEELEAWVAEVRQQLELEEEIDIAAILDLAKDFAHNVARPAAPLTTFALGLAIGRSGDDPGAGLDRLGERLRARATEWPGD